MRWMRERERDRVRGKWDDKKQKRDIGEGLYE